MPELHAPATSSISAEFSVTSSPSVGGKRVSFDDDADVSCRISSSSSDMIRSSQSRGGVGSGVFAPDDESKRGSTYKDLKAVRELTINKLHYEAIELVGREKEIDTLRSCLSSQNGTKELVLISGYSGIGKSKIAHSAHAYVKEITNNKGIVVQGKFDQNAIEEPYSAISAVFGELCKKILDGIEKNNDPDLMLVRESILGELMSEMHLLQRLIPFLSELANQHGLDNTTTAVQEHDDGYEAEFERLKYGFRVLTRLLCNHFSQLVLIVDDLQWADAGSLQMIDFLLSDSENDQGLAIIGLYRSNEVHGKEGHPLSQTLNILESKGLRLGINITRIEVKSLTSNDVNRIIMAMLGIDDDGVTNELAEICFRRTLGNPFFVIEFITMLEMEGMISFNLGLLKWTWDEKSIEDRTMSTANVVELLKARMKRLPEQLQVLLEYAACLGAEFRLSVLETILDHSTFWDAQSSVVGENNDHHSNIQNMLKRLERGNFIEAIGNTTYRWIHDKIQEAALTLGVERKPSIQYDVGWILYCNLSGTQFEEMLFEVTNLINMGNTTQRPDFAQLNLRAAEKSRDASAFHSAAAYAEIGIELLPDNKWSHHAYLALKLYTIGAEMEVALGNASQAERYFNAVLSSDSHVSILDKLPAYVAKSLKLTNIDLKHGENLRFACQALIDLGYWVPTGMMQPFHALRVLRRTIKAAKKRPIKTFEKPKIMKDPSHKAAMLFLSRVFYSSYFTGNKFLLVFSAVQMVQMTLDHGVSNLSGQGYASLGMVTTAVLGDIALSTFLAETGIAIQKTIQSKYMESQTVFLSSAFILSWSKPISSQLDLVRRTYSSGLRSGNVEYGFWCQHAASYIYPFIMGKPLHTIVADCAECVPLMEELQQNEQALMTRSGWQHVLHLMGEEDDVLFPNGKAREQGEGTLSKAVQVYHRFKVSDQYLFYGDYKRAAESALARGEEFKEIHNALALVMIETFHRAIALFAMARKADRSIYSTVAQRLRKRISGWAKNGNPNVKHYECFLEAENSALLGKKEAAKDQYQKAITMAARTGHLHHAALFNERFADFLKHDLSDEEESFYRLKEAIRWYKEWGAKLKAKLLQKELELSSAGFESTNSGQHQEEKTAF